MERSLERKDLGLQAEILPLLIYHNFRKFPKRFPAVFSKVKER
jgi:hypothetical protein